MSRRAHRTGLTTRVKRFPVPLRIGVIGDTHIHTGGSRELHRAIPDLFRRAHVDLVVHLGDANVKAVLEDLAEVASLVAVPGNNDDPELHHLLPRKTMLTIGSFRFGIVHGDGFRSAAEAARSTFDASVDCVLFGHSHKPSITREGSTIYFNPGSATDRRWYDHFGVGLIDVSETAIEPELVLYTNPEDLRNITFDEQANSLVDTAAESWSDT